MKTTKTLCSLLLAASIAGCADKTGAPGKLVGHPRFVPKISPLSGVLEFTTKENLFYRFDVLAYTKGAIVVGSQNAKNKLVFYEAGEVNNFKTTELGDYVVLTGVNNYTHIVRYQGINPTNNTVSFTDTAVPGLRTVVFNSTTRLGYLASGYQPFAFIVERTSPYRLGFDNNGDGVFDCDMQGEIVRNTDVRVREEDLLPKY